jgi:adenylate cyclase
MAFNCDMGIGCAHFIARRYDEAIHWEEKALAAKPSATWIHRSLSPTYALAGDIEKARESIRALLEAYPDITISKIREALAFSQEVMGRFAEGLRMAGLPE